MRSRAKMFIQPTGPKSLADQAREARKDSVLLNFAYLYATGKGSLVTKDHRKASAELLEIFEELVVQARKYKKLTNRQLPILGELGEIFAEIMFGISRHGANTQGSDGMLGKDFVEVKTITPGKRNDLVKVKRVGNFGKLVVVKISDDFQFGARMVDRKILKKGDGKYATLSWDSMIAGEPDQDFHRSFPIRRVLPKSRIGQ